MSEDPRKHLTVEDVDGVVVVRFEDEQINSEDLIKRIGDELYGLVEGREGVKLLLDFSAVRFVSSSFLGKLIQLQRKSMTAHGKVKLCGLSPYMNTIFEVSRLNKLFVIYFDEQAALDAF